EGLARGESAAHGAGGGPVMDIIEVVGQVRELLQQQGRLSYRIVCRQFALDESALEDLKFELIDVQEVALDKDGKMLVWKGDDGVSSARSEARTSSSPATPPAPPAKSVHKRSAQ